MNDRWQIVTTDVPPIDTPVLVYGAKACQWAVAYRNSAGEWLVETCSDLININPPRWWQPLPSEPEELSR